MANDDTAARPPLYYTFGNHMHWVDMQWLWGYDVLPGSVRDMLALCRETGARGNVNFDGIGYEKMAAECPDALAELRQAVQAGTIEPVGCSYGQPYALFQGLESNIRQFTYGVRSVMRLLGVRPRTFWEEEFYFLPQLPQILRGCGYDGACLFFQWTWHTPEVPKERASLIEWEGVDGSRILTLPRNELNVHQWPEDFDGLLEGELVRELERPAVVQWLELMPSRDWMCRSEVLLPRLQELMQDKRFDVRPRTCAELIEELKESEPPESIPVRQYGMHEVWHGMTLGKNGDRHPRSSVSCEDWLRGAEAISAVAGLFGRPYPGWDVYPTWELEEAWRELLAAQHHDNHECEGLCGFGGHDSFDKCGAMAGRIFERTARRLAQRVHVDHSAVGAFNSTAVQSDVEFFHEAECLDAIMPDVPAFGWRFFEADRLFTQCQRQIEAHEDAKEIRLVRGEFSLTVDRERGLVTQVNAGGGGRDVISPHHPFAQLAMIRNGATERLTHAKVDLWVEEDRSPSIQIRYQLPTGEPLRVAVTLSPTLDAAEVHFITLDLPRPDGGILAGLETRLFPSFAPRLMLHDTPGAVHRLETIAAGRRKYPKGDWMTSEQWFETVHNPFTAFSFVDLLDGDDESAPGVLLVHDGGQQFIREERGVRSMLSVFDPWDEEYFHEWLDAKLWVVPHGPLTHADRQRIAIQLRRQGDEMIKANDGGDIPHVFGPLSVENAPGVLAQAFFRESMKSGEHLPRWAGHRMYADSQGACDHPYVIRLVEWNGEPAEVTLKLAGDVALAARTNLMGEVRDNTTADVDDALAGTAWLDIEPADPPNFAKSATFKGEPIRWSQVRFRMRPHEIATIMADMVMGRKEWRDLDAKREVWATVHRET